MSESLCRIHGRYYGVNFDKGTFYRAQPENGVPDFPHMYTRIAANLLTCRYHRSNLTEEQNATARAFAQASLDCKGYDGDCRDINVAMAGLRIIKETEFLRAVAAGDEEALAEIERDEAGAAMFAKEAGGHQIGSAVLLGVAETNTPLSPLS